MVKIIFLADTHLGFDYPLRPRKEIRRRGIDFFTNFDKVLDYAKSSQADLVIHGGDLFFRTEVPQPIIDMVYERIFNFVQTGIPLVIVPGNHESSELPISLLLQHPNIHYFTKPEVFSFKLNGSDFSIAGFPYEGNGVRKSFRKFNKELQKNLIEDSIKLLCIHQSVEGAKVGPSEFIFRYGDDVIPIKDIPSNYNLVLSGHIHRAQVLWADKTPVIYPGSIERTSFSEKNEAKGFCEIKFDNECNYTYEFIELGTRPMVDILLEKEAYTVKELKKEISDKIKIVSNDSIIRFKFSKRKNLAKLNEELLDELVPSSMNYQVAGRSDLNIE